VDLDGLGFEAEAFFAVGHEFLDIFTLIPLKLNHLSHLSVVDDGAIASEFLLDDLEDFLLVEFLGQALDSGQGLSTIALLDPNMDIALGLVRFPSVFVRVGEGVNRLQVLDGHKLVLWGVLRGGVW